ncbi:MAG: hypothetical protein ACTSP4_17545 [Candidatus Hodarchaeales archaeon]
MEKIKLNDDKNFNDGVKRSDYIPAGAIDKEVVPKNKENNIALEWKDYVAITIAALQTVIAPTLIFIILIIILSTVIRFFFGQ